MNLYQIHGLLQFSVFVILFPLGALIALFRNYVGENWKLFHVGIQLTAVTLFIIAVSMAIYMGRKYPKTTDNDKKVVTSPIRKLHKLLGRIIGIVILFQLVWAYKGRNYVNWTLWYYIHMALSASIILLGWTNITLAFRMKNM